MKIMISYQLKKSQSLCSGVNTWSSSSHMRQNMSITKSRISNINKTTRSSSTAKHMKGTNLMEDFYSPERKIGILLVTSRLSLNLISFLPQGAIWRHLIVGEYAKIERVCKNHVRTEASQHFETLHWNLRHYCGLTEADYFRKCKKTIRSFWLRRFSGKEGSQGSDQDQRLFYKHLWFARWPRIDWEVAESNGILLPCWVVLL